MYLHELNSGPPFCGGAVQTTKLDDKMFCEKQQDLLQQI
jgi:hypothetical protein